MPEINLLKQAAEAESPVLLFEATLPSGDIERWATHGLYFSGSLYEARVLHHNLFDLQLSSDDAMDGVSRLSLTLANADSVLSELNSGIGFKGTQLTVRFGFADLASSSIISETTVLFRGIAGDPEEITESTLRLSFTNKLSLQRIPLPEVRVQRTCPWSFPTNQAQRVEALAGVNGGKYSHFARCGYSAGVQNGLGNLDPNGQPFISCDKSRTQCQARGMFNVDGAQNQTRRFGGFEYVPSAINVRTAGDKTSHLSPLLTNSAKYNDAVPLVYGTGWLKAPIIFARNDGNSTHVEALLGLGPISGVLKVVVNDVEIPVVVPGQDQSSTGCYTVFSSGNVQGSFNLDFLDAQGVPAGDPYGSMAAISVVVPNRISAGTSLPTIEVLMQGAQLAMLDSSGAVAQTGYTNNPAWVILDILRRCGWSLDELNLLSFYASAQFCAALITSSDLNGNPIQVQRYQTNLVLTKRQSAATVVRGIRVASSLMLRYGANGLLELLPETTLTQQHPQPPDGSNCIDSLDSGWPAYEFSDGSAPFSGIVRSANGSSTVRITSRSAAECSNRLSVEFQDEQNEYQQDSLSIVDSGDSALIGYEISSQSAALGIPNYNQAMRVLLRQLDKTLRGNLYVEFQTSFRALKVRPGDIITLTYLKEGFQRFPLRVVKLSPSANYCFVTITAQIHNDDWYSDDINVLRDAGRQPASQVGVPKPLIGLLPHKPGSLTGGFDLAITENVESLPDGTATDLLTVGFSQPKAPTASVSRVPLVSLAPRFADGGVVAGQTTYYYAVSSLDSTSSEGPLSFTIRASVTSLTNDNSVILDGLSFPAGATSFNVYRGSSPQLLYRIASAVPIADQFVDGGLAAQPVGPPDASFDHANLYYRYEAAGPFLVTGATPKSLLCQDLGGTSGAYKGMLVRIIDGKGQGQERSIADNDQASITITTAWSVVPDASSTFVICESAWKFAAVSAFSPMQFAVPYRSGAVLHISGRSANVHNQESAPELCPLTRVPLGQSQPDFGVPGVPSFTLSAPGGGLTAISEIGFIDQTNIVSITSGTLNLYYWNELSPLNATLSSSLDAVQTTLNLPAGSWQAGTYLQVGTEILYLLNYDPGTSDAVVLRGQLSSAAIAHQSGEVIVALQNGKQVVPFAQNFFENRASINLIHTFAMPDIRIVAAQFFVSNGFGNSQVQTTSFAANGGGGLRTLSGGQLTAQVNGYLATENNAIPPIVVPASHAVRDIRATVGQIANGYDTRVDILQGGIVIASLLIPAGQSASGLIDGAGLPVLQKDALVTANLYVLLNPAATTQPTPARDLTITLRS